MGICLQALQPMQSQSNQIIQSQLQRNAHRRTHGLHGCITPDGIARKQLCALLFVLGAAVKVAMHWLPQLTFAAQRLRGVPTRYEAMTAV